MGIILGLLFIVDVDGKYIHLHIYILYMLSNMTSIYHTTSYPIPSHPSFTLAYQ
jgi:hypothetical protein